MRLEDKIYWGRFLGGVVMGILTEVLKLYRPTALAAIFAAILVYVVSAIMIRKILSEDVRRSLGRKLYLSGAGTYAAIWLLTWILVFNLLSHPLG